MAVWIANPEAFAEFDRWLFAARTPPTAESAVEFAAKLVGREQLQAARADARIDQSIELGIKVFERAGLGKMPKLIVGDHIVNGEPASASQLFELLESRLGIGPR